MKFLFATKESMTRFFSEKGEAYAATILSIEPSVVTQVKDASRDGYEAVQVGFRQTKEGRLSKSVKGHMKGGLFSTRKEVRGTEGLAVGDSVPQDVFVEGDKIVVTSVSKGKGFQGVVKRHGFKGGWGQHGQKHSHREPGSIGATWPQRVLKGKKMAGRMGSDVITQKNIEVLDVDQEKGRILVRGAVPGKRGTLVKITK